ncbi:serine/threonine protein kinase [Paenibacillus oenotherae]|uniref:Serine/threonine protein kinase n=1 Tax=Paenibacillus oenotherae TaxID=1435645 RepID=A0ABS7D594_9BACL|nr:serine/threonine protein kinase [Paenibacillus oenotherae]
MEKELLPGLVLESVHNGEPIVVRNAPEGWKKLGAGNYAAVFAHSDAEDVVVKVYAPGREGWEDEVEVYRRLGDHPAYSRCYYAGEWEGRKYLVMKRLHGTTLYECVKQGIKIPKEVIDDIDAALDYARERGLHPHDVHGKNVMVADGRGIVVDVSDFLKTEPCLMWDDLKKAYNRFYMPFLSKAPVPMPDWVMNSVRKGYRLFRSAHS